MITANRQKFRCNVSDVRLPGARADLFAPVTVEFGSGDHVRIVGPNGSGKSSLLRLFAGVDRVSSGEVKWECDGRDVRPSRSFTPDSGGISVKSSVRDWISDLAYCDVEEAERNLRRVGLDKNANQRIDQLSFGMLKRARIALAISGGPDVLFIDEPYSGLDVDMTLLVRAVLEEEVDQGKCVVSTDPSDSSTGVGLTIERDNEAVMFQ